MSRDSSLTLAAARKSYFKSVEESFQLLLFNLYYIYSVSAYAQSDLLRRQKKHLPSDFDKLFTPKLYENDLIQSLKDQDSFRKLVEQNNLDQILNQDVIRSLYLGFSKTSEYQDYIRQEDQNNADHLNILLLLYKHMCKDDLFIEENESHFKNWGEDNSLVIGAIKKVLKTLPVEVDPLAPHRPDTQTIEEFGETLLLEAINREDELIAAIQPILQNWDIDRVATIDMILLKMALTEFLSFPTIPPKVTLNEYVEVAKLYSTDKSKDFINGILDKLLRKLSSDGKINKEGRGLIN